MSKVLKVYGWTDSARYEGEMHQCRFITAAHSVAEVLRVAGITRSTYAFQGSQTWNDEELMVATGWIGAVFYRPLYVQKGGWAELAAVDHG
jgi:hypothetical protein